MVAGGATVLSVVTRLLVSRAASLARRWGGRGGVGANDSVGDETGRWGTRKVGGGEAGRGQGWGRGRGAAEGEGRSKEERRDEWREDNVLTLVWLGMPARRNAEQTVRLMSAFNSLITLASQITELSSYGYLSDADPRDAKRTRSQDRTVLTELSGFNDMLLHAEQADRLGLLAPVSTDVLDDCRDKLVLLYQDLAVDVRGVARLKSAFVCPLETPQMKRARSEATRQLIETAIQAPTTPLMSKLTSKYQYSLDRILEQPPAYAALALRVIAWIIHAERQLTAAELLHAFAVGENGDEIDKENLTSAHILLQACMGLVVVNDDMSVGLVHFTAHTFFADIPERFVNAHKDMATTCLRYLCMRNPFGAGPCNDVLEMEARLRKMPFLAYAARHWGQHARRVEQSLSPLICQLLHDTRLRASAFQALQYRTLLEPRLAEAWFAALPTGQDPLHVLAYWDLGETAELYVDDNTLSPVDAQGWTPLHWACFKGSMVVRELLLRHGAALDMRDSLGWTPLFWAALNGDIDTLTSLFDRGADHLVKDKSAWTALQWAVSCAPDTDWITQRGRGAATSRANGEEGFLKDISISKPNGVDLRHWRSSLLHVAIRDDKISIARLLLELGADPNYAVGGRPALHTAAFRRDPRFVDMLLEAGALIKGGANINMRIQAIDTVRRRTRWKQQKAPTTTPLMLACGSNMTYVHDKSHLVLPTRVVHLLLTAGADTTLIDASGHAVIRYAIEGCDLSLVKLLLENGATIPAPDPDGCCAIHTFAEGRSRRRSLEDLQSLLDLLLERLPAGAESMEWHRRMSHPVGSEAKVYCPLSLAIKSGNWDIFAALLKRGAHLRTTEPLEPLLRASIQQLAPAAVHFLLDQGAKPAEDHRYITELLWRESNRLRSDETACDAFHLILRDLVQGGVDINVYEFGGQSNLLIVAKTFALPAVAQALLDSGADLYHTTDDGLDLFVLSAVQENVALLSCLLENTAKVPRAGGHWTQPLDSTDLDPFHDPIAYICACLKRHNLVAQRAKASNKTLLQLAVESGSARTVANLIACGADADEADDYGWTPLHTAIFESRGAVVDVLLAGGVNVHAVTRTWQNSAHKPSLIYQGNPWAGQPLHLAAMTGDAGIVAELLTRGADVRASTDSDGRWPGHGPTALNIALDTGTFYGRKGDAFHRGRLEIAAMLVERGADVHGVVDHLGLGDVLLFEGFEDLWNKLRVGVSDRGQKVAIA
ncbi:ankyrin repeat-containing domain protein [Mycena rosella]|uniref:Ankyrin repeat-containing domain protein n=1 Tax=Mycena rosella TaxID=1033263 RepID=A0AAD7GPM3_MYCRO|nr:ankyrin repeat-containing domain protein [Mycena rosella]